MTAQDAISDPMRRRQKAARWQSRHHSACTQLPYRRKQPCVVQPERDPGRIGRTMKFDRDRTLTASRETVDTVSTAKGIVAPLDGGALGANAQGVTCAKIYQVCAFGAGLAGGGGRSPLWGLSKGCALHPDTSCS